MTSSQTTRYIGAAVGIAAAVFFGISTLAAFGISEGTEYALPAFLAVGTILATIGVARGHWWSAVVISAFLAVPVGRMLMQDSTTQWWIVALAAGALVELAVAALLARQVTPALARS